jgi:hypothetical protein
LLDFKGAQILFVPETGDLRDKFKFVIAEIIPRINQMLEISGMKTAARNRTAVK